LGFGGLGVGGLGLGLGLGRSRVGFFSGIIRCHRTGVASCRDPNLKGFALVDLESCKGSPRLLKGQIAPSGPIIGQFSFIRLSKRGTQWRNPGRNSGTLAHRNIKKSHWTITDERSTPHDAPVGHLGVRVVTMGLLRLLLPSHLVVLGLCAASLCLCVARPS